MCYHSQACPVVYCPRGRCAASMSRFGSQQKRTHTYYLLVPLRSNLYKKDQNNSTTLKNVSRKKKFKSKYILWYAQNLKLGSKCYPLDVPKKSWVQNRATIISKTMGRTLPNLSPDSHQMSTNISCTSLILA